MVSTRSTPTPRGTPVPQSLSLSKGKQSEQQSEQQQQQQPSDAAELLHVIHALRQQVGEFQQQVNELQERLDVPPPVPPPPPPNDPLVGPQPSSIPTKDPLDRIKQPHVSKYDGSKTKEAESWVLEFTKYCCLIRITENNHILIAFAVAMTDKAGMWWEYAKKSLPHPVRWQAAKEVFLKKYGNILKQQESTNKLKKLCQNSMTIADFFTEAEDLNLYPGLDPETLPDFLRPGLNAALQNTLYIANLIQPISTYADWKAKALHVGTNLKARVKDKSRAKVQSNTESNTESDIESNTKSKSKSDRKLSMSKSNSSASDEAPKVKTKVVQVPGSEKER